MVDLQTTNWSANTGPGTWGVAFDPVVGRVAVLMEMESWNLPALGKPKRLVQVCNLVCYVAVEETTISQTRLARHFSTTQTAVSMAVDRNRKLAAKMKIER